MSASDDLTTPIQLLRVTVVTATATATTLAIDNELRREPMHVELALLDILDSPPAAPVYVVSLDSAIRAILAPKFVAWAATSESSAPFGSTSRTSSTSWLKVRKSAAVERGIFASRRKFMPRIRVTTSVPVYRAKT